MAPHSHTLGKKELHDFYGSRLKAERVLHDAGLASEALSVSARFKHGADIADQIAATPLIRLMEAASLIARDADELMAQHPDLAEGLSNLLTWWTTTFPGGGPKPKTDEKAPAKAPEANGAAPVSTPAKPAAPIA